MSIETGQKAPHFRLKNQDGEWVSLKDFKGKRLILYFYPKDMTSTCTVQACNIRDHYSELKKANLPILGISTDDTDSHKKFVQKYKLPFPLLADIDKKMVQDYGVWVEKNMFGNKYMGIKRTTFVIDEKGKVEHIISPVKSGTHVEQILKVVYPKVKT